jgi:LacI family transcriptional regulator
VVGNDQGVRVGKVATTVYDIARAAGVGRTTVLRALWDKDHISPETKARIKKIAAEMNYRPNYIARSLVRGKSNFIGVMVTPSIFPSSPITIDVLDAALREAGYSMLLESSGGYPGGETLSLERMAKCRVAGVIAVPSSTTSDPGCYQELINSGVNLVVIDRYVEGLKCPQVIGNDYRAGYLAAEHLISLGHRRIAYLAIPETSYSGRERARGIRDAISAAGLEIPASAIVQTQFGDVSGYEEMTKLLQSGDPPTAVIARHDIVAVGAMRAIVGAGLSIPKDISLVGNGNVWFADALMVPLTTFRHPIEKMAEIAVRKLLDMVNGQQVEPTTEILDVEFIQRSSTAPPGPG